MRPSRAFVVAFAALVLMSACGGQGAGDAGAPTASPSVLTESPTAAGEDTPASPSPDDTEGGGAVATTVVQSDFTFSPSKVNVQQGETIAVSNRSPRTPHTFTVPGKGIDVSNGGHETKEVTVDLPAGTYEFVCTFHEASGMKGTLTVT